jgi:hypothetical protein
MGLDNLAQPSQNGKLSKEDEQAFIQSGVSLGGCEGMFRGKIYDECIYDITGESLYQDWIPPKKVKKMYRDLVKCDPKKVVAKGSYSYPITEHDILELRTFFRICAERKLGLLGWY